MDLKIGMMDRSGARRDECGNVLAQLIRRAVESSVVSSSARSKSSTPRSARTSKRHSDETRRAGVERSSEPRDQETKRLNVKRPTATFHARRGGEEWSADGAGLA